MNDHRETASAVFLWLAIYSTMYIMLTYKLKRLNRIWTKQTNTLTAWFLDPNDAALSKYARGEPRDRRWIQAGVLAGVVSMPIVKARIGSTNFYDSEEEQRARVLVEEDRAWFELVKNSRAEVPLADYPSGKT